MVKRKSYNFLMRPFSWIHKIYCHIRDYDNLSQQHNRTIHQNLQLIDDKKVLESEVGQLNQQLRLSDSKNEAYRKKFIRYRNKVENSEKYKQIKLLADDLRRKGIKLEERASELTEKVNGFDNIYRQQKSVIAGLHKSIELGYKKFRKEEESLLEQIAENDKEQSYVYIGGSGRIIASTPTFREKFNFNDPDEPIKGKMYFKVLQPPKDFPDHSEKGKYVYDIKYAFRDQEEVTLETTIADGKHQEKIIQFIKHKPAFIRIVKTDNSGQKLTIKNYFYTKVEVYDIGRWERAKEVFKEGVKTTFRKILHIKDGEPKELHEYVEKRAIQRRQKEEEELKSYHQRIAPIYAGLIAYNTREWNDEVFSKIEHEKGIKNAEIYLKTEYEKLQKQKLQQEMGKKSQSKNKKNKLIGQIIGGVIEYKSKTTP